MSTKSLVQKTSPAKSSSKLSAAKSVLTKPVSTKPIAKAVTKAVSKVVTKTVDKPVEKKIVVASPAATAVDSKSLLAVKPAAPVVVVALTKPTLARRVDLEAFLSKLGAKDRANAEKHLADCDAEADPRHGQLWRRAVCALKTLAEHATKVNGRESVQFYVPDGKYKLQVFAMHDSRDGTINMYCGNVLVEAVKAGIISPVKGSTELFSVAKSTESLKIEELDENSQDQAPFFKHMLGWGRKALRIVLPTTSCEANIAAAEALFVLSVAKHLK